MLPSWILSTSKQHKSVMVLIRDLVLSCLRYNILFRARHVPGLQNSRADYIFRFQVDNFKELAQRQTNSQQQYQRTFYRRVGHSLEGFIRLSSNGRHQKIVPESMGVVSNFLWTFLWVINSAATIIFSPISSFHILPIGKETRTFYDFFLSFCYQLCSQHWRLFRPN